MPTLTFENGDVWSIDVGEIRHQRTPNKFNMTATLLAGETAEHSPMHALAANAYQVIASLYAESLTQEEVVSSLAYFKAYSQGEVPDLPEFLK